MSALGESKISTELQDSVKVYGLEIVEIKKVDLRKCYLQGKPDSPTAQLLIKNGKIDTSLSNSPHYEFADLYFHKGLRWLKKNYETTKYYKMRMIKGRYKFPGKVIKLCNSIEKGYLKKKFRNDYILMLNEPFAKTRYNRKVDFLTPEILSGHHRAAILLALNKYTVPVVLAKDIMPGACKRKITRKTNDLCL